MNMKRNSLVSAIDLLTEAIGMLRLVSMAASDIDVEDYSSYAIAKGCEVVAERITRALEIVQIYADSQLDFNEGGIKYYQRPHLLLRYWPARRMPDPQYRYVRRNDSNGFACERRDLLPPGMHAPEWSAISGKLSPGLPQ